MMAFFIDMKQEMIAKLITCGCEYFVGERLISIRGGKKARRLIFFVLPHDIRLYDTEYLDATVRQIQKAAQTDIQGNYWITDDCTPFQWGLRLDEFNTFLCIRTKVNEVFKEVVSNSAAYDSLHKVKDYMFSLMTEEEITEHYGKNPFPYIA